MKLSYKLALLVVFPLLLALAQTWIIISSNREELSTALIMRKNASAIQGLSNLINEMQKERGRSSIYVSSSSILYDDLAKQIEETDRQRSEIELTRKNSSLSDRSQGELSSELKKLESLREEVKTRAIQRADSFNQYTALIKKFLDFENELAGAKTSRGIGKIMIYVTVFESAKEKAGQLRATLSGAFTADKPLDAELKKKILEVKTHVEILLQQIINHKRESSNKLQELLSGPDWNKINQAYWTVIEKADQGNYGVDGKEFFGIITNFIEALAGILRSDLAKLNEQVTSIEQEAQSNMNWSYILVLSTVILVSFLCVKVGKSISAPIKATMTHLDAASNQLRGAAEQVSSASQSLAQGATKQASSIQDTSVGFQDLAEMTRKNAQNASHAEGVSAQALGASKEGLDSMLSLLEAMDQIKVSANQTAAIVSTIDEIAFQTNLLALNAAVEAARAGDSGLGFAVVAEEVRRLAQRSSEQAKSTSEMLSTSIRNVEAGVSLSKNVSSSLEKISSGINEANSLVTDISSACTEQASRITSACQAIAEIDRVTQDTAAASEQAAAASEELNAQSEELHSLVDYLKQIVEGNQKGQQL